MIEWMSSFLDEMSKLAEAKRSKASKGREALVYGSLGAMSGPAISGVVNMIARGKIVPKGVKPGRWLAGTMTQGALLSGAMPFVRRSVGRHYEIPEATP